MHTSPPISISLGLQALPDVAALRRLYALPSSLSDFEVAEYGFQRQRVKTGVADLPPYLLQIVSLSLIIPGPAGLLRHTYAPPQCDEGGLIQALRQTLAIQSACVHYWGDAPVPALLYGCAQRHQVPPSAPLRALHEASEGLSEAQWFNLAQPAIAQHACPSLHDYAQAIGLVDRAAPSLETGDPWRAWLAGDPSVAVRRSSEAAYLSYALMLQHQLTSGQISPAYHREQTQALAQLKA